MGYIIVRENNKFQFEQEVQKMMEKGWEPIGGISMAYNHITESMHYAQALVKSYE